MVFDITYSDQSVALEMMRLVGRPFGWFSKTRWSGIGSERCKVIQSSGTISEAFKGDYTRNMANIELRPKGVIVRIRYRLEVFALAIPYDQLVMRYEDEKLLLGAESNMLTLITSRGKKMNENFLEKVREFQKGFLN